MGTGKKVLMGLGIFVVLAIIAVFFIYKSLTGSSIITAQLNVESGQVLVNGQAAQDGAALKQGDIIETGADGQATVILYESVIVNLEPNTKISLSDLTKQHPQVTQESGATWNKFTKLSGVEQYSVKTGNSVASVRGTAFGIKGEDLLVGEGDVEYNTDNGTFEAGENEIVALEGGKRIKRNITAAEAAIMRKHIERSIATMQHLRDLELKRNGFIFNRIKASQGWTDEDVKKFFQEVDNGNGNIDELVNKSPIKVEGMTKLADISRKIREEKLRLLRLQNMSD